MLSIESDLVPITVSVDWRNRRVTVNNRNKKIKLFKTGCYYDVYTFNLSNLLSEESEEPVAEEDHTNFVLGRKKQFIHDFWPLPSKCCRKERMSQILDNLIPTDKDVEQCIAICSIKLNDSRDINDFSTDIPDFITKDKISSNEETFGRHYQYILDNDPDYTYELLSKMSIVQIERMSFELHDKKSN